MSALKKSDFKKGLFWNAVDTYSAQGIQFVVGVILARLLSPTDYGIVGMTLIFTCIAEVIINSGFPTALLRKQDCSDTDYSTVFWFNTLTGIFLYVIVYLLAPFAAEFYNQKLLTPVIRVISVTFIICSVAGVSSTIIKKRLQFKDAAKITMYSSLITGVFSIILAYKGYGVWTLVFQSLVSSVIRVTLLLYKAKWVPSLTFSSVSFKELFGFGSKLLGSNIISQIYSNLYIIIIGKFFSAATLGFFSRADGYSRLIPNNIQSVIQKTLFPLIAKVQNEDETLRKIYLRILLVSSFLIFPASFFLAAMSYPLISIFLSDKWLPSVPLLQILCVATMFDHISSINNDFITVKGRSNYVIKIQFYTKIISIVILFVTLPFGLIWLTVGKGITSIITVGISCVFLNNVLGITMSEIVKTLKGMFICSFILGAIAWFLSTFIISDVYQFVVLNVFLVVGYFAMSKIFYPQLLKEISVK